MIIWWNLQHTHNSQCILIIPPNAFRYSLFACHFLQPVLWTVSILLILVLDLDKHSLPGNNSKRNGRTVFAKAEPFVPKKGHLRTTQFFAIHMVRSRYGYLVTYIFDVFTRTHIHSCTHNYLLLWYHFPMTLFRSIYFGGR